MWSYKITRNKILHRKSKHDQHELFKHEEFLKCPGRITKNEGDLKCSEMIRKNKGDQVLRKGKENEDDLKCSVRISKK